MLINTSEPIGNFLVKFGLATEVLNKEEPKPESKPMTVAELQAELNEHFDAQLEVDGKIGPKTTAAIVEAEKFLKLAADGLPDVELYDALRILKGLVKDFTPPVENPVRGGNLASTKYELLKDEYRKLYDTVVADNPATVVAIKAAALKSKPRYMAVTNATGCPWDVIALIHRMEGNSNFSTHLHNGDSLNARTVHVPAGRPLKGNPPFSWEESAIDALGYDGLSGQKDWCIERKLHLMEGYNGWGYRTGAGRNTTPACSSPYLWGKTNHHIKGKYVADGKFDPEALDDQTGAGVLLKALEGL